LELQQQGFIREILFRADFLPFVIVRIVTSASGQISDPSGVGT
jgi:hypothetical protein